MQCELKKVLLAGASERPDRGEEQSHPIAFSFEKTKRAIQGAIQEAAGLEKGERMKRIKQLRLRWHPGARSVHALLLPQSGSYTVVRILTWAMHCADKNPELQEFASEVTKIINEALRSLDD